MGDSCRIKGVLSRLPLPAYGRQAAADAVGSAAGTEKWFAGDVPLQSWLVPELGPIRPFHSAGDGSVSKQSVCSARAAAAFPATPA